MTSAAKHIVVQDLLEDLLLAFDFQGIDTKDLQFKFDSTLSSIFGELCSHFKSHGIEASMLFDT